jgi:cell division protein ZipA
MGTREWLTVIIGVAILAVIIDGIRRMRANRRNSIKMSAKVGSDGVDREARESYGSELPSGGARVVIQRDENEAQQLNESVKAAYSASRTTSGYRIPEQVTLNLDESVPMLMDSVAEPTKTKKIVAEEPSLGDLDEVANEQSVSEPEVTSVAADALDQAPEPEPTAVPESTNEPEEQPVNEPEEVMVINVMAPKGYYFAGMDLLETAVALGMRFGEMNIFHRHRDIEGNEPILFSMANIVRPGHFDLEAMEDFRTPGISFFLVLPCATKSMAAFDLLYQIASDLAEAMGGELKDENRSVLTAQTLEHYRQRIRDFERQRLMPAH